ncbi:hypothetical protein JOL79_11255 [Microbispora sp. RL4-1S]|uniref:Uncharacterized protein n=1 Tax=Microbispora oryzae TaxID=2806554 RepID=A0A940WF45_9ACTN|nr:hypothetical protein [Microbispora oryzae]MBP2704390.1 hypothetical protein [Microbispora oryzae]
MNPQVWTVWDCELGYSRTSMSDATADLARPDGAEPKWLIYEVDAGGRTGVGEVPHSLFEWQAAAHGLDPDDMDTILDSVLHLRFIPSPHDALAWTNPAMAKVLEQTDGLPDVLTPGVSDATRREAHLARIGAVKQHLVRVEAAPRADRQAALQFIGSRRVAPAHPLGPMRQIRLDPHRVQSRKLAVEWRRGGGRPDATRKPPSTFLGPMYAWPEPPPAV